MTPYENPEDSIEASLQGTSTELAIEDIVTEAAYDFLELDRAAMSTRLNERVRARPVRRVSLITLDNNNNFVETPTRPVLQRQNAMGFLWPFENNIQHNAHVAAFLELLNGVESSDDDDVKDDPIWSYVLTAAEVDDDEWECVVCQEGNREEVVWHPSNCHTFHNACLDRCMLHDVRCPLCRSHTTPLLMRDVSDEGEMMQLD